MAAKNEWGLTPQQEKFAQEVAKSKSQSAAYRIAYPKSEKWKDEAVHVAGAKMMAIGNVSQRVATLQAAAADRAELDASEIIREIRRLAVSDIAGIMTAEGKVKLPHELDPATRAAIKSFRIDEYGRIEYQFWDKGAALEKAAKIKGLFKEDNDQKAVPLVGEVRLVGLTPKDAG
jgi:phage terminase small subunit